MSAADGIPVCLTNGLIDTELNNATFELWIAALTKYAGEHEPEESVVRAATAALPPRETKPQMAKLAEGPWRSLGGYFDYSLWPDRERFLELDRAISAGQDLRDVDTDPSMEMV